LKEKIFRNRFASDSGETMNVNPCRLTKAAVRILSETQSAT